MSRPQEPRPSRWSVPRTLQSLFRDAALGNGSGIAFLARAWEPMTYSKLAKEVEGWSDALACLGVERTDRIVLVHEDGPAAALASLSIACSATCAPLHADHSEFEFEARFRRLRPRAVVLDSLRSGAAGAAARGLGIPVWSVSAQGRLEGNGIPDRGGLSRADAGPEDVAFLLPTSGTTALPKWVPLTHRNLCHAATAMRSVLELEPSDRCLNVMPLVHIHGLSLLFASMAAGGSVAFPGPFSGSGFWQWLREFQPTWYSAAPAFHRMILDGASPGVADGAAATLRFIRSASAPMPEPWIAELESRFGVPFVQAYGMTEASPQIASRRPVRGAGNPRSVGKAAGPEVRILDGSGRTAGPGMEGEILIRGENVITGYWEDPAADQTAFIDGWLRTGDSGYIDGDGHLFITGRLNDVINRGGEKISPREVEVVLEAHPRVRQAVVFPVSHPVLGQMAAAAVCSSDPRDPDSVRLSPEESSRLEGELRDWVANRLAHFKVPNPLLLVRSIPTVGGGKIQRRSLATQLNLERSEAPRPVVESEENWRPAERALAALWKEVLGVGAVGRDDNFFTLGGHSISAGRVSSRIRDVFGVEVPMASLFGHPTLRGLSGEIGALLADRATRESSNRDKNADEGLPRPGPRKSTGPFRPSHSQERLWFLDRMDAGPAYHMSASLRLKGTLHPWALEEALALMCTRHEALRCVFPVVEGRPVQVVAEAVRPHLPVLDLQNLPQSEREDALQRASGNEGERPFDLATGPLIRFRLVALAPEEHVLLTSVHHIVFDGWSLEIFHRELAGLYGACVSKSAVPLPPLPFQFPYYAEWQRRRIEAGGLAAQREYWRKRLRGAPELCTFPTDHPRSLVQGHRGGTVRHRIPSGLVAGLSMLASAEGGTLFMSLVAAFQSLLGRYSGLEDCVVGTPVANRETSGVEGLIGFFANTVVLRTDLSGTPTFSEVLRRVRETILGAIGNQGVPFEMLVEDAGLPRNPGRMPLFQVMLVHQNPAGGRGTLRFGSELSGTPWASERMASKFDLTLYLDEDGDGMTLTWLYDRSLYERSTVERLAAHFEVILQRASQDPHQLLSDVTRVPESEAERLWSLAAGATRPDLAGDCYHEHFERIAAGTPDSTAVVVEGGAISYAELNGRANRLAHRLRRMGVGPGVRVAMLLPRELDLVVAILAISKSGGAFMGLDPLHPTERIRWMIAKSEARLVVTTSVLSSHVSAGVVPVLQMDADRGVLEGESSENPVVGVRRSDPAYVLFTSGTTGYPKGVVIPHSCLSHYVGALREVLEIRSTDRYLHTASFSFSSSVRQFSVPLCAGAAMVLASSETLQNPQRLLEFAKRERVTVMDLVPSHWRSCDDALGILDPERREETLANDLRLMLSASEPMPGTFPRRWESLLRRGVRMFNLYGQTETTGIVASHEILPGKLEPGSVVPVGRPIPNLLLPVLDDRGYPVPQGVVGEVHVTGEGVRPVLLDGERDVRTTLARSIAVPSDGPILPTGDLGRWRWDGVLEIVGRKDQQVKIRGIRVEPAEVELRILEDPAIRECGVVAVEPGSGASEPNRGTLRWVALVVLRSPVAALDPAWDPVREIRERLRRVLPAQLVPDAVLVVDQLPRTASGKVDRVGLREHASRTASTTQPSPDHSRAGAAPRSPAETCLAGIWREVLGVDRVGIDENFFDLGGDSLRSVEVVLRARAAGLNLDLHQHFRFQSISALSEAGLQLTETSPVETVGAPASEGDRGEAVPLKREIRGGAGSPGPARVRVDPAALRRFGIAALEHAGLDPEGARCVTEVQLESSLRGQPTHGMDSIPRYARRIRAGTLNSRPRIRVISETGTSASMDGDNGPGQWVAMVAMELAIRKARESGIGVVTARRSNHLGAVGHYAWEAARAGMIGLCTTNGPVILAPTGGVTPTFGNNPLGVGIPAGNHPPVLLDIAMSVAPRGRIALQVARGEPLPPGWILDRAGRPSTDLADLAAGLGVPIGGHKGYGLAMIFEILSGVLSGAEFGRAHDREHLRDLSGPPDYGHFFLALDPQRFLPGEDFRKRVDGLIEQTRSGERAEGSDGILIPGERELRTREISLRKGVLLDAAIHRRLADYALETGLNERLDDVEPVPQ